MIKAIYHHTFYKLDFLISITGRTPNSLSSSQTVGPVIIPPSGFCSYNEPKAHIA